MRIPKKLSYGGHLFRVEQHRVISPKRAKKENSTYYGEYWGAKHLIKLRKSLVNSQKEQSLFHEIVHMIDHQNKGSLSEDQVCYLAKDLYAVLKTNKMLR